MTVGACIAPPGAPAGLRAVPATTLNPVATLEWSAPAGGGAEQFVIEAGLMRGSADARIVVPGTTFRYETPAASGIYFVRVRATNACGESGPSNEAIVYVPVR